MFGDRMKQARIALGYSAEQVAEFLNVSPATVYRYEKGDISKFPSKLIKPLADYLCVSPAYLMDWQDMPETGNEQFWTEPREEKPKNDKVRLLIRGMNKLSDEQIDQATAVFQAMFMATNPDLFRKGNDNDT